MTVAMPEPDPAQKTAVVIGASGGIGAALVTALRASGAFATIHALSRTPAPDDCPVIAGFVDVTMEDSIAAAAKRIAGPVDLTIVATGLLHEDGHMPEKALNQLDGATLQRMFAINSIGPALVLKHFAPLLPRDRPSAIAVLSARIGSISDNRTGGWYGYRASKAALNMIVRTAAIELRRTRPQAICIALHPGTVDTALSTPFQRGVPPGRLFSPQRAARQLIAVIARRSAPDSGRIFAWDGAEIAP